MTTPEDLTEKTKIKYIQESDIKGQLKVSIQAGLVSERMNEAYKLERRNAQIPGFRKGKVPMHVVKQQYKHQVIRDTFERLVSDTTRMAAMKEEVPIIGEPRVTKTNWLTWEEGMDMEYTVTVELLPNPELKKYKGLEVTIDDFSVGPKHVDKAMDSLRKSKAIIETVEKERGVRSDDLVIIDFQGELEGEKLEDASAQNFMLEVDNPDTLPEFQDALIGMKAGEEKKVPVQYAEDYAHQSIAGKEVSYHINLHEIKKKTLPEWSDELAKEFEAESLDELKAQVKDNLVHAAEVEEKSAIEEQVLTSLVEANKFGVPQTLIAHQLNYILRKIGADLERQHFSSSAIEDYMKRRAEEFSARAEKEVQLVLLLSKVVDAEKIEVSEDEIKGRIKKIVQSSGKARKEVETFYKSDEQRKNLKDQITCDKGVVFIIENAKVKREKQKE